MNALSPILGFAAGALTILSPCVLPLVPIVLGGAANKHRFGPLALASGLVLSFTLTGFVIATLGASIGLTSDTIRIAGAVLLLVLGVVLLVPGLQHGFERLAGPLANWASARQLRLERFGLLGQGAIGALLGLVWSPCVGPTLGAAMIIASQGQDLGAVAVVISAFGLGIASVLLAVALVARSVMARWRGRLLGAGQNGKRVLGALVVGVALLIVSGGDRAFETLVLMHSPNWLTNLTTAI
jgi:cytochrome c biogenesis protein CcdA